MINYIISLIDYPNKLKVLKFFKKNLNNDFLHIIDIGGHKGETLEFFLNNFNINKIFVFEPNKELFEYIKNKFNSNKIYLFNYGVGIKNEKKILNITVNSASSTINNINKNTEYFKRKKRLLSFGSNKFFLGTQTIKVVNLSEFILHKENKIDILKIDTEGYEFKVIKGLGHSISKIKLIHLEHHFDDMIIKNYNLSDIHNYLISYNFVKVFKIKMKFRKSFEYIYESI